MCTVLRESKSSLSGLIYKLHLVTSTMDPDNGETPCQARDYVLELVWCMFREGRRREKQAHRVSGTRFKSLTLGKIRRKFLIQNLYSSIALYLQFIPEISIRYKVLGFQLRIQIGMRLCACPQNAHSEDREHLCMFSYFLS